MTLTYPFLNAWYDKSKATMQSSTVEWLMAKCKGMAGGKSYPANQLLSDTDEVTEGISDVALYKRVYNAVVPWAGKELAERVAKEAMPPKVTERDAQEVPYREGVELVEETMTNEDTEGLTEDVGAIFLWNWVKPSHLQELFGENMEKVPDYVPAGKRRAWAAMWDAIVKKNGGAGNPEAEKMAFAVTNAKYAKKG